MKVNVIGNGPSAMHYWDNEDQSQVVSCNLPWNPISPEKHWGTVLGDFKVMKKLEEGSLDFNHMKWICGTRPKSFCDNNPSFYMKHAQNIREFYTHVPPYAPNPTAWSAGHLAVHYTCVRLHPSDLHMWGFDSMFSYDLSSSSDLILESDRREVNRFRMNSLWRPIWNNLFDEMSNVNFVIHAKKGVDFQFEVPDNVTLQHH